MLFDANTVAFASVALVLTVTPGNDTILVLRNAIRGGSREGMITGLGICTGLFVHALLSALGLSLILMHSAELYHAVKWAGAAYIVWLGFQALRDAFRGAGKIQVAGGAAGPEPGVSTRRRLFEGFLCNVLNPKVVVFYLAFLPQFIGPQDPVVTKSILLAGIHWLMGLVWLMFISWGVDLARAQLARPAVRRGLDAVCGFALVGLGVRLAMDSE
ncbi:resistance to homoserine/threonine (RhtB) family protein [Paucidesulfovibrio gracilis DSM 16080]|uniref:Resistance to homoserine/threonine (RhtB) family protein n=1 Tax=Paucidesulfovibrio gracilis DSM 16080 TaxID=1121449 RepID=A0A1T4XGH8_9BACT|nr:LysE family translocator [Paucidesulfovibrio gracilis]SKA88288.1 resistance to homoserine/threonine (RhtB) family protein [Paucidesulfovibrio gracilis DSM 16080]